MRPILLPQLTNTTVDEIERWILDNMPSYAEGAVLGMSGGIDSSVVCGLTQRAFNRLVTCSKCVHYDQGACVVVSAHPLVPASGHCSGARGNGPLTLRGYSLPTHINTPDDNEDAYRVAGLFYVPFSTINLSEVIVEMEEAFDGWEMSSYHRGNMISRTRANALWTLAAKYRSIVMGTGNKDEDYGVGYYTLLGDGAVHMNPIGFLPKRLVREVGKWLGLPIDLVNRVPTAGLEANQTDAKDLGYSYAFVELVIAGVDQGAALGDLENHPQIVAQSKSEWVENGKIQGGPAKFQTVREAVFDVLSRHDIALKKAKYICPKVPNIKLPYGVEEHA